MQLPSGEKEKNNQVSWVPLLNFGKDLSVLNCVNYGSLHWRIFEQFEQ